MNLPLLMLCGYALLAALLLLEEFIHRHIAGPNRVRHDGHMFFAVFGLGGIAMHLQELNSGSLIMDYTSMAPQSLLYLIALGAIVTSIQRWQKYQRKLVQLHEKECKDDRPWIQRNTRP